MTSVAGDFGDHKQRDFTDRVQSEVPEAICGPPGRRGVQRRGGDDGVRTVDLLPVPVEDGLDRRIRADLPGMGSYGQLVDDVLLARDNGPEPESLDIQGKMLDESQACPPRRQDRSAERFFINTLQNTLQDSQRVGTLSVQLAQ